MAEFEKQLKKLSAFRWWDSRLIVGLAIVAMIYTRFFGLGAPYIKAFDPYLFWRISDGIWNTGAWQGADALRYFPFGWDSKELAPAMPYTLVYLGKIAGNLKASLKFYPALFGLLSVLSMALLMRRLGASGLGALILAIIPGYMFRTSQGFADKEPLAFFLGIQVLYFIATAIKEEKVLPAIFAGISIGMISAVWGGKILFALSLAPLLLIFILGEKTRKAALLSITYLVYLLLHFFTIRYHTFYKDPVSMAIFSLASLGLILHAIYLVPSLEKYGKKRILIALGVGGVAGALISLALFGNTTLILNRIISLYNNPSGQSGVIRHSQTVAENQRVSWTWNLRGNQFYSQFGVFFFMALAALTIPILRKAYSLARKQGAEAQDYVYAGALVAATAYLLKTIPHETAILLLLLGIPGLLDRKDWKESFVISVVSFSIFAGFSTIRVLSFTSIGVAIGAAYFAKVLLEHREVLMNLAGYAVVIYAVYQIYPFTLGYTQSLGGTSLTTTWFENAKWMEFNVPKGEPVTTWWDYGYWIQTIGNTTSLGDGGNVGPGYLLNWYTGHFFATDDYANATTWAKDWNLTYFTIDAAMLPKFWAYATLGGISNVLNQLRYYGTPIPSEYGMITTYRGVSDDYGPVAVGELNVGSQPVYLLGRIVGGSIQWTGTIDEFTYFSNTGSIACDPIGYCKAGSLGNLPRLNQSAIIYKNQMMILGDKKSMHSTFARLWFFDGYNTDFNLVLNNGETKTFEYQGV